MRRETLAGCAFALLAFGAWGINPLYFKAVTTIPALELLAHRVIWALPLLALIIATAGRWSVVRGAFRDKRTLALLAVTALLLSANWLIYIWAINDAKLLEASLGYYINPLLSVLLGFLVLRERLTRMQVLAVILAAGAVLNLIVSVGTVPWLGLSLTATFSIYALLRKVAAIPSLEGLFVETLFMLAPAAVFLFWLGSRGESSFATIDLTTTLLLIASGPVTALPLLWFTSAARRLRLGTVGIFQYIAPSLQFLLGVFLYDEPFGTAQLVTFALIWIAVALYASDAWRQSRDG